MNEIAERLSILQEESDALIGVYDPEDRLRYANRAFREAYFIDADETPLWPEIMRRNHRARRGTIIEAHDFEGWLASAVSRRGKIRARNIETSLYDGRWIWVVETVQPDGWMLFVGSDVTAFRCSERSLRQDRDLAVKASVTDELTGVSNRRQIFVHLDRLVAEAELSGGPAFSVCLLDLDHFKAINDAHGHLIGDCVLVAFARAVQATIRLRDCFGRVGGEEFLLIFPKTSAVDAHAIARRVLGEVRKSRPLSDLPDFAYSSSAGLAAWTPGDTAQALYMRADEALYRAKREGRDRAVLATRS